MLSSVTFSLAVMKVKKIHEPSKKTKQASALNKAVVKKYNKEISSYKIKVITVQGTIKCFDTLTFTQHVYSVND